jgi:hypothetical protein
LRQPVSVFFPQFSIFSGQPHQIPAQSEVQGVKTANNCRERAGAMGGARTGSPNARNVVVIVGWSKTTPTSFMRLPDLSQLSTSILNVRLRGCAQDMRFLLRVFFFVCGACQWWTLIVLIAPTFGVNEWSWFVW